jgi:DNA-binding CsgD family transcriptional regulator/PAS domain-containing protein
MDGPVGKQARSPAPAPARLSNHDNELDLILDGLREAFYAVDSSWRVTRFNAVAANYFGVRACDVVGRVLWQVFPQAPHTALGQQFLYAMRSRQMVEDRAQSVVMRDKAANFRLFPLSHGMGVAWLDMPLAPEYLFDGVFETVGFGIVGMSSTRYAIFANAAAHAIFASDDGLRLGWSVHARASTDEARLETAIGQALDAARQGYRFGVRVAVSRPSGQPPYIVHISAVAHGPCPVTLTITDPERASAIGREELIDVFGLTPAEARLVLLLADGKPLTTAASLLRISIESARAHLACARAKTQTASQVDLVRLLTRRLPSHD